MGKTELLHPFPWCFWEWLIVGNEQAVGHRKRKDDQRASPQSWFSCPGGGGSPPNVPLAEQGTHQAATWPSCAVDSRFLTFIQRLFTLTQLGHEPWAFPGSWLVPVLIPAPPPSWPDLFSEALGGGWCVRSTCSVRTPQLPQLSSECEPAKAPRDQ